MVAAETRGSIAARQAAGSLPWFGVDDLAEDQRLRADHAARVQESVNVQLSGPEKRTSAHDPQHVLKKNGGLADQWCVDDGDLMCHPVPVLPFLQRRQRQSRSGTHENDLDAAPSEWRNQRRAEHGQNLCSCRW